MKKTDQQLIWEHYHNSRLLDSLEIYIVEEGFLKKIGRAAAIGAAGLGMMGVGGGVPKSHPVNINKLATNQPMSQSYKIGQPLPASQIRTYTQAIEHTIINGTKAEITNVVVEVVESKELESGKIEILYSVTGEIHASSPKEAKAKAMRMIEEAFNKMNISQKGLNVVSLEQAGNTFPFELKLKILVSK